MQDIFYDQFVKYFTQTKAKTNINIKLACSYVLPLLQCSQQLPKPNYFLILQKLYIILTLTISGKANKYFFTTSVASHFTRMKMKMIKLNTLFVTHVITIPFILMGSNGWFIQLLKPQEYNSKHRKKNTIIINFMIIHENGRLKFKMSCYMHVTYWSILNSQILMHLFTKPYVKICQGIQREGYIHDYLC